MPMVKRVKVAAGAIIQERRLLAAQRGYGTYKGFWEFPGGKIEQGETPQQALQREIEEEMGALVEVGELIGKVEYTYPEQLQVTLYCFLCTVHEGVLKLLEHENAAWLDQEHLYDVEWLAADIALLDRLKPRLA